MILTNDMDTPKIRKSFSEGRCIFWQIDSNTCLTDEDKRKIAKLKKMEDKQYGRPELPKNKTIDEIFEDPSFDQVMRKFGKFSLYKIRKFTVNRFEKRMKVLNIQS